MKSFTVLVLILTSILLQPLLAQKTTGQIAYTYTTTFDGFILPRQANLIFSNSKSLFIHSQGNGPRIFDRNGQEVSMADAQNVNPTNKGRLFSAYMQDPKGNVYFTDFAAKKMLFREIVVHKAYLVEEPEWIDFQWKLIDEIKRIGRFKCQKAETSFRGRKYTAWYTRSIPLPYGPWKFHGLPGLILEVVDDSGEVKFVSTEIKIPASIKTDINSPSDGEKISLEGFLEAEYKIRKAMVDAQRASAERKAGQKQVFKIGKVHRVEISLK